MESKLSKIVGVTIIIIMLTIIIIIQKNNSIETLGKLIPIEKVNTNDKVVAIACNVYEGREELNKILSVLEQEDINVSFFIGGVWADNNRDMIIKMKNMGHDIQNHGYYHKSPSTISKERNISEIKDTEQLIYNISGVRTNLFEPPSGDFNEVTLGITQTLGYRTVTWSIDTIDWREDATGELILKRIRNKLHPGGIILIHPKPVTANSISNTLQYLKSQGYRITTVSDLINNN